jgi:hypothetical protein
MRRSDLAEHFERARGCRVYECILRCTEAIMSRTEVVVKIEGAFDAAAARAIQAAFLGGVTRFTLDLSRALQIHDSGLALVASDLLTPAARAVTIVGLGRHHERLLRYLGAHLDSETQLAASEA